MTDALHESIDASVQSLLKRCERETGGKPVSIAQHADAIQVAIKWVEARSKLPASAPEPEKDNVFTQLKESFHGKRRGGRPRREPEPEQSEPPATAADEYAVGGDGVAVEAEAADTPADGLDRGDVRDAAINGIDADESLAATDPIEYLHGGGDPSSGGL